MTKLRNYTELSKLETFEERFEYLKLGGSVGKETFGHNRWINQELYKSYFWREIIRPKVILRDAGCDLGIEGRDIFDRIEIHHMNPITLDDIRERRPIVFDIEYLITTRASTHKDIHYGTFPTSQQLLVERKPNDTIPWRKK